MIPNRVVRGKDQERDPLGVEFVIGRWVPLDGTSAAQAFGLERSLVIAPEYEDNQVLKFAKDEATFVLTNVPGTPADPADLEHVLRYFKEETFDLVHFVGHGSADDGQTLDLSDGDKLSATQVRGLTEIRTRFQMAPTLVLLNACDVGRPAPALRSTGGLAQALIKQRAAGVIAALWSVDDSIAHRIAKEFYQEALKTPPRPFAEIIRDLRKGAYDEAHPEDTYAAYCFYGDPRARRA
jgi:CHAT domain-containing protein